MLDSLKDDLSFVKGGKLGGDYYDNYLYDIKNREKEGRDTSKPNNLTDFARESESEREDEDIISHYRTKMQ